MCGSQKHEGEWLLWTCQAVSACERFPQWSTEMREPERNQRKPVLQHDVVFHKIVKNHSTALNNRPPCNCNQPDCGRSSHTVIQINKQWHNERRVPHYAGKTLHLICLQPLCFTSRYSCPLSVCFTASSHEKLQGKKMTKPAASGEKQSQRVRISQ